MPPKRTADKTDPPAQRRIIEGLLVGIAVTILGTFAYEWLNNLSKKKEYSTKVYGEIYNNKHPAFNAAVKFLNHGQEDRTDREGNFAVTITGTGMDSVTVDIQLSDGQKLNKKVLIDYKKEQIHLLPITFPVDEYTVIKERPIEEKNKVIAAPSGNPVKESTPQKIIEKETGAPIVNPAAQTGIAVMATVNNEYSSTESARLKEWAMRFDKTSLATLQGSFISQGYFNKIFSGNAGEIKKIPFIKAAQYVCLMRLLVNYEQSHIDESLKLAIVKGEVIVVATSTGEVLNSFRHTEKASDISDEKAFERAEKALIDFLQTQTINL